MFGTYLEKVRANAPLVHNITNYVTVNDVANALLASGASPIMSDDVEDARDITSICDALVINIGTLNERTIPSMFAAGKRANELGHVVVLDPVGAGASALRTDTAHRLLAELHFDVVRGNISEIKALARGTETTKGVDAAVADAINADNLAEAIAFAQDLAAAHGTVVAITGALDLVADAKRAFAVRNGDALMSRITGSGCMLSALVGAYVAANAAEPLEATVAAIAALGLSGQTAAQRLGEQEGNASFRTHLIDALYRLSGAALDEGERVERLR